jgi:hypothetical protein
MGYGDGEWFRGKTMRGRRERERERRITRKEWVEMCGDCFSVWMRKEKKKNPKQVMEMERN